MPVQITLNKARVPVKVFTQDIEHDAIQQLLNVAQLPIVHGHVAAMPDVHHSIGATVGSVIPTKQAIIPAAVGVDIGCGMNAVRLTLHAKDLPENLAKLRSAVEARVPVGHQGIGEGLAPNVGASRTNLLNPRFVCSPPTR